jgi:hypothetical protein
MKNSVHMKDIIPPADPLQIQEQLQSQPCLDSLSRGRAQLYVVDGAQAPLVMQEIGRQREIAFRSGGGGTGLSCDMDRYDQDPALGFRQLICWDSEEKEIMGGYRVLSGRICQKQADGQPDMPSAHLFHFSEAFVKEMLPVTLELSRSFIVEKHQRQSEDVRRNVFTLDQLFSGLSYLSGVEKVQYVFGKVTFYPSYPQEAFSMLEAFFRKYCLDTALVVPHQPYEVPVWADARKVLIHNDYREDFRALRRVMSQKGYYIPPILSSYIKIFKHITTFGAAVNDEFGNVVEMGLLASVSNLLPGRYAQIIEEI